MANIGIAAIINQDIMNRLILSLRLLLLFVRNIELRVDVRDIETCRKTLLCQVKIRICVLPCL